MRAKPRGCAGQGLSEEGVALQRAVVAELAKADLQPLGIEPEVVLRDAHVEVAAADGPKVCRD